MSVRDILQAAAGLGGEPVVEGALYVWGGNNDGVLGLNDQGNALSRSSPTQLGSDTDWITASPAGGANAMFAIKSNGTLWAWGINTNGLLGLGDVVRRSSPVQVGALSNWAQVTSGSGSDTGAGYAIKTDGTLWSWGINDFGQLGQDLFAGTYTSSPAQVGASAGWAYVAGGLGFAVAVKTDGTLWGWGTFQQGRLANNAINGQRSSPVQIGSLTDWDKLTTQGASTIAVKTDGTLWAWGSNNNGLLGLGDTSNRSSPVQVGALSDWAQTSIIGATVIAVKTDGTLWGWGSNNNGQLGLNNGINYSSPVQIGALTTWSYPSAGTYSHAIKTDGTLWALGGFGTVGRSGLGDVLSRSSPVQVGAQTDWVFVEQGQLAVAAIRQV